MAINTDERDDWEDLVRRFLSGDVGTPEPPTGDAIVCRGGNRVPAESDVSNHCIA